MDDRFKFAQHLGNAAYDYEMQNGGTGVTASLAYSQTFALEMFRDDIDRAYGRIMAIYGLAPDNFSVEQAADALALLDKALAQKPYEAMTPDELRKDAYWYDPHPCAKSMRAAAAAWEARERILAQQVERNSRLVKAEHAIYAELTAANLRLEAAREGWDLCLAELKRRDKRLEAAVPFVEAAAEEAFTGANWAAKAQAWLDGAALAGEE